MFQETASLDKHWKIAKQCYPNKLSIIFKRLKIIIHNRFCVQTVHTELTYATVRVALQLVLQIAPPIALLIY